MNRIGSSINNGLNIMKTGIAHAGQAYVSRKGNKSVTNVYKRSAVDAIGKTGTVGLGVENMDISAMHNEHLSSLHS